LVALKGNARMQNFYFSAVVDNDRTLYIAPLCDRHLASSGQEVVDTSGYFLYERRASDPDSVRIIAQVLSDDAALELREMLKME
jgi:hypothetical protein